MEGHASSCPTINSQISNNDSRDIHKLLDYIEGNKTVDKEVARKKADKKARQRTKKMQIKVQVENKKRLEEGERRKEEERVKAEAQLKLLTKTPKRIENQEKNKTKKTQKGKQKGKHETCEKESKRPSVLIEEHVSAIMTTRRSFEDNSSTTAITITLNRSIPEFNELCFKFVNENVSKGQVAETTVNSVRQQWMANKANNVEENKSKRKQKNKSTQVESKGPEGITTINKDNLGNKGDAESNKVFKKHETKSFKNDENVGNNPSQSNFVDSTYSDIDLNLLGIFLPQITITKIKGSPKNTNNTSTTTSDNNIKSKKKNKKKRNQKRDNSESGEPSMVTSRKPLFNPRESTYNEKERKNRLSVFPEASVSWGMGGMVTIRRAGLQNPDKHGYPMSTFFSDLKPGDIAETAPGGSKSSEKSSIEEILSGFKEIEISKVDKGSSKKKA